LAFGFWQLAISFSGGNWLLVIGHLVIGHLVIGQAKLSFQLSIFTYFTLRAQRFSRKARKNIPQKNYALFIHHSSFIIHHSSLSTINSPPSTFNSHFPQLPPIAIPNY
jgi:hypothetical protein